MASEVQSRTALCACPMPVPEAELHPKAAPAATQR